MAINPSKSWITAMDAYGDSLKAIVGAYEGANILELGAGRYPSFRLNEMPASIASCTVNDISEAELSRLPAGYNKARFDVSGDASNFGDQYDVVFSRFLAEHVPDGLAMHRNVYNVLKTGGTAFHLIPTLYAVPFVINKYFPEKLSAAILSTFSPRRDISPKFPAYYSACYANSNRMESMLARLGYRDIELRNFYGHFYYEKIPVLKQVHERFSALAADRDWEVFGTYAYIKAVK